MRTILLSITLLLTLQVSDCATAGSIQDSSVTKAKRELDAEALAGPTPTPRSLKKLPQRPGAVVTAVVQPTPWPAPEVVER